MHTFFKTNYRFCHRILVLLSLIGMLEPTSFLAAAEEAPRDKEPGSRRVPWTTSRVIGSPDPPLPYTVERVFTAIQWRSPMYALAEPGSSHLLVVQQGGEANKPSQILRLSDDPATQSQPTVLLEIERRLIYGLTFHPDFVRNGFLYVFTNGPTGDEERVNRVSRFTVNRDEPRGCDRSSEKVIIEWRSMGHDGGDLVFGHDGMLYITTGDGTSDSDGWVTGQDLRDLNGGVLRLNVDQPTEGQGYSIPSDNPFLNLPEARGELWAYGLRNPWRMTIDARTGQIWVGNNGQDLWETAHLLRSGENYGWSVYEGNHPFHAQGPLGPTPPVPPTLEHSHAEARSLTGGVVYYGDSLPNLNGVYVYGDYSTGKIWGARHDGKKVVWHQELTDTGLQIAGFGLSSRGDLIVVDHAGGLYRMIPATTESPAHPFPVLLSDTGLFSSVADYQVQAGVVPYSVNAPGWNDGASADHYLAIPGDATIEYSGGGRGWNLPEGTVLMQTLTLPSIDTARPLRRIETRILTKQQNEWVGYSYRWKDDQTDATLVAAQGADLTLDVMETASNQTRTIPWHIPSRTECMNCHSRAVGYLLSMNSLQLNKPASSADPSDENPLKRFHHLGLLSNSLPESIDDQPRLVNPYEPNNDLDSRARSYLHVNCAGCHVEAGGGNARMELEFTTARDKMRILEVRPLHDTFKIPNAMLIAPGDPERSILYHRISQRGRGQMPPLVSQRIDQQAKELFGQWIRSLSPQFPVVKNWQTQDLQSELANTGANRSHANGEAAFKRLGCAQCHRFQQQGGGAGPALDGIGKRLSPAELLESLLEPSKKIAPEFATTVIETNDGQVLQGRILEETPEQIVLQSTSSFTQPLHVATKDIDQRSLSSTSIMPAGMLDTLESDQILDLLAYLIAEGSAESPAFSPATNP